MSVQTPESLKSIAVTVKWEQTQLTAKLESVTLRVPVDQVTYACHDPEDTSVFAVIVRTEQQKSFSGLRLHAFQAEQKTATAFVRSARELFQLMYKIMKAKKRMSGQLEESPMSSSLSQDGLYTHIEAEATSNVGVPPATANSPSKETTEVLPSDIDKWVFPGRSETFAKDMAEPSPSSRPSQQGIDEERRRSVMEEWKELDVELKKIAKELGMDEEEAATPSPPLQRSTWPDTRVTPFDTPPSTNTTTDPFADEFFQKSFDSPSKFNAAIQQSTSPQFSSFGSPTPNPTTDAGFVDRNSSPADPFTSTPDGQVQPTAAPANTLQHRSSRQELSFALNPFQSSHGIIDPFQSGANAAYDSFSIHSASTGASVDLANPLYGSQDSSMFPGYQSPFSDTSNPALVMNSLGFSPNISGAEMHPMATSSQNTSQNVMAGNPFSTDFQSPFPFSMTGSISDPFQSSLSSPPLSISPSIVQQRNASIPSSANDPFADLIPLALEAVEKPEPRQANERSKQPMVPPGAKPSWDTFDDSSKNHLASETKQPSTTELEPAHHIICHSSEIGTATEATEQETASLPLKNRNATANGFDDSFHEAGVFSDFDKAFEASGRSNTDTSQAFEGSLTMKPAEVFTDSHSISSPKASPEVQFSVAIGHDQTGQPLNTDTHGFGDDFTSSPPSTEWVSF